VEVLVQGAPLELGKVEGNRGSVVCILSQELMAMQVIFCKFNQLLGCGRAGSWEDLGIDMATELLYPYLIITCLGSFYYLLECDSHAERSRYLLEDARDSA